MALVRKILETTLTAGSTSVTFTDTDIPNSLLRVYCTKASLFPLSQTLSGNVLSVNYKAQSNNVGIALEIVKQGLDIVDDLESEDATKALSANQGYILKGLIDGIVIPTVPENITDLDDVDVTSITNGQVLAWNSVTEKFENVNQSSGGTQDYSTTETVIGTYNNKPLYRKIITGLSLTPAWQGTYYPQIVSASLVANVEFIINARAFSDYSSNVSKNSICSIGVNNGNNTWAIIAYDDFTITSLMIEYTKTTD